MRRIGAEEARTRLPELLEHASRGGATLITKRGRPYAALVPAEQVQAGRRRSALALKGSGKGCWGRSTRRALAALRDEWR